VALIQDTAVVDPTARIGEGSRVWHHVQIREGARIGRDCIIGKGAFIDADVTVGDRVKIQNNALVYQGAVVEDGVFIGPAACLTNDKVPRAVNPDGSLKSADDWHVGRIVLRHGCSVGAGAIVVTDVTIGRYAMVAAGAVVATDVPDHALVMGVPARVVGYVCACGHRLEQLGGGSWRCSDCGQTHVLEEGVMRAEAG